MTRYVTLLIFASLAIYATWPLIARDFNLLVSYWCP